ncbi:hypothetical protein H9P43_001311 [Blastocladiella emersonii ATCC 22665]|nr:hypothetical protein H9P43_001311 [Blastocladiella emersonii ATCC 22665]
MASIAVPPAPTHPALIGSTLLGGVPRSRSATADGAAATRMANAAALSPARGQATRPASVLHSLPAADAATATITGAARRERVASSTKRATTTASPLLAPTPLLPPSAAASSPLPASPFAFFNNPSPNAVVAPAAFPSPFSCSLTFPTPPPTTAATATASSRPGTPTASRAGSASNSPHGSPQRIKRVTKPLLASTLSSSPLPAVSAAATKAATASSRRRRRNRATKLGNAIPTEALVVATTNVSNGGGRRRPSHSPMDVDPTPARSGSRARGRRASNASRSAASDVDGDVVMHEAMLIDAMRPASPVVVQPALLTLLFSLVYPALPLLKDPMPCPGLVRVLKRRWLRHDRTSFDDHTFSVMSWNILAPAFERLAASSPLASASAAPAAPAWPGDYASRRIALMNEILYYEHDVICLQEVDPDDYADFFLPILRAAGYAGVYAAKSAYDGCATFFRHSRFAQLATSTLHYRHVELAGPSLDAPASWHSARTTDVVVGQTPFSNLAQVVLLQDRRTGAPLRIVNTHLLWQPEFAASKLLQTAILLEHLVKTDPFHIAGGYAGARGPASAPASPVFPASPAPAPMPTTPVMAPWAAAAAGAVSPVALPTPVPAPSPISISRSRPIPILMPPGKRRNSSPRPLSSPPASPVPDSGIPMQQQQQQRSEPLPIPWAPLAPIADPVLPPTPPSPTFIPVGRNGTHKHPLRSPTTPSPGSSPNMHSTPRSRTTSSSSSSSPPHSPPAGRGVLGTRRTKHQMAATHGTPTVICGDLNSLPTSPVLELLLTGGVSTAHFDGAQFGRFTGGQRFEHSLALRSAYPGAALPYTHRRPHFSGTIDHVLFTAPQIKLVESLGAPEPQGYLDSLASLPSPHVPSDHLPLLCVLKLKPSGPACPVASTSSSASSASD